MRKSVYLAVAAGLLISGAAYGANIAPLMAAGSLVVHASGGGTVFHASGSGTAVPQGSNTGSSTTYTGSIPSSNSTGTVLPSGTVVPYIIGGGGEGKTASGTSSGSGESGGIGGGGGEMQLFGEGAIAGEGAVAKAPDETAGSVTVTFVSGASFTAARMRTGLNDDLRIISGRSVIGIRLALVSGISFGERELGRLPVAVTLRDGSVVEGNIYPGVIFEFEAQGRVSASRAAEIASIAFVSE